MSVSAKLRRAPLRIATGAYILNSGVTKLGADDDAAKSLHGMASGTYPVVGRTEPKAFAKALGASEIAVGAALLLPVVPTFVAGAALAGFSGALLNMYWHTPGLHAEGTPRPTAQGMPLAKDVWMFGIGVSLMADAAFEPAHDRVVELEASVAQKRADRSNRARRRAKKVARRAKHTNAEHFGRALAGAMHMPDDVGKRAKKARKKASKKAEHASESAAARLAELRDEYGPAAMEKARAAREAAWHAAHEYGPAAAEKARAAREAAREFAEEYRPVAARKAKQKAKIARHAAKEYTARAQKYGAMARERVAG